jgi:hypothetical protein
MSDQQESQPDVNMEDPHNLLHELVAVAMITLLLQEATKEVPSSNNGLLELAAAATKEVPRAAAKKVAAAATKKVPHAAAKKVAAAATKKVLRAAAKKVAAAATKKVPRAAAKKVAAAASKKVPPSTSKRIAKKRVAKGAKWCKYHLGDKIWEGATVSCKWIDYNEQPIEKPFTGVVVKVNSTEMTVSYHAQPGYSAEMWPHTFYDFETRNGHVLVKRS